MCVHSYEHGDGAESGQKTAIFSLQGLRKRLANTAQSVRKRVGFTRKLRLGPIERCVLMKITVDKTPAQVLLL